MNGFCAKVEPREFRHGIHYNADSMPRGDHWFRDVMEGEKPGLVPSLARSVASAVEPVYRHFVDRRNRQYDIGRREVIRLDRPVISIGNLSTGGTGKTPVVAYLARLLASEGNKPAVLTRGYKSKPGEKGDEQLELESLLGPNVPVVANPNRVAGARAALDARPDLTHFLLDDGFQHRRVHRDLNIVLVSATQGLSGGHVLPRGLLREPPESLRRASVLLLTKVDQAPGPLLARLERTLDVYAPGVLRLRCRHVPTEVLGSGGERMTTAAINGKRLFAVAGTGQPDSFERTLASLNVDLVGRRWYPDHHAYTPSDAAQIGRSARTVGADALITTGKDATKLTPLLPLLAELELLTLHIAIDMSEQDRAALSGLIRHTGRRD